MTPHDEVKQKMVAEWLRKADEDLGLAEHLLGESLLYPGAIAFHCQQSAEKHLKALLVWREVPFPKTHDIKVLLNLIEGTDAVLAESLQDAVALTAYGVELRYPGDAPEPGGAETREAFALAQRTREGVLGILPPASP